MKPGFDIDRMADVLVDAHFSHDDEAVAKKYGISLRSVRRYREHLEKDERLAGRVSEKLGAIDAKIRDELVELIRLSIDAAKTLVVKAKESGDPQHLHAVIGAVKIAKELKLDDDVLNGPRGKNRQNPKAPAPSGNAGNGTGGGSSDRPPTVN